MLFKLIQTEQMKLKRSPVWLAFLLMPIIPALLGTLNYLSNIEILQSQWYSLWTQHTLFTDYFFLPIMIGIYCSYLMHMEGNNLTKLFSLPLKKGSVFISKLVCASGMIFASEIWICVLFVISGKAAGINASVPVGKLMVWCLFGTMGGIVTASIQLMLSLFIKSFALPVGISLLGGLSGLLFLAKDLGHIWPYSLMAYGMNSNAPQELIKSGYIPFILTCILYIAVFSALGSFILNKRDV